jgi:hypothetical protein
MPENAVTIMPNPNAVVLLLVPIAIPPPSSASSLLASRSKVLV